LAIAEPPQFEEGSFLFKVYDRNKQVCIRILLHLVWTMLSKHRWNVYIICYLC